MYYCTWRLNLLICYYSFIFFEQLLKCMGKMLQENLKDWEGNCLWSGLNGIWKYAELFYLHPTLGKSTLQFLWRIVTPRPVGYGGKGTLILACFSLLLRTCPRPRGWILMLPCEWQAGGKGKNHLSVEMLAWWVARLLLSLWQHPLIGHESGKCQQTQQLRKPDSLLRNGQMGREFQKKKYKWLTYISKKYY